MSRLRAVGSGSLAVGHGLWMFSWGRGTKGCKYTKAKGCKSKMVQGQICARMKEYKEERIQGHKGERMQGWKDKRAQGQNGIEYPKFFKPVQDPKSFSRSFH